MQVWNKNSLSGWPIKGIIFIYQEQVSFLALTHYSQSATHTSDTLPPPASVASVHGRPQLLSPTKHLRQSSWRSAAAEVLPVPNFFLVFLLSPFGDILRCKLHKGVPGRPPLTVLHQCYPIGNNLQPCSACKTTQPSQSTQPDTPQGRQQHTWCDNSSNQNHPTWGSITTRPNQQIH